jgi:GNAT superfamily N-acetyltransferase
LAVEIRPPLETESDELFEFVRDFATSFAAERNSFDRNLSALVSDPDVALLCAFMDGRMAGYVLAFQHQTLFAGGPVAWVEEVYVGPEFRQQGIARALMAAVETKAKSAGCRLVALATRRASEFYEAIGYEASATYYRRLL